ncbi:hypothetical protein C8046_06005 [Serinibacter arcticus]|uniref:Uncharacterized protein n=1 Tax=Serinibacter arcticus TaxID=1655435 RepID=A0A2U1ZTM4_9MICO|nr:DUF58 domain-containing protein [Serinibacter arcticus]PWD50283.1 hypothetical protein C8046_06005 [Serinibacter arcticus]
MTSTRWGPTLAWTGTVVVAVVVALVGVVVGRPDAIALVAPVLVAAVVMAARRRDRADASAQAVAVALLPDAPAGHHRGLLSVAGDGGDRRLRVAVPGYTSASALIAAGGTATADVRSARTGPLELFRVDHAGLDDGVETPPAVVPALRVVVEPGTERLGLLPLPDQLVGLTGAHTSRRRGDGDDLHDIAPFRSGDRLRRIDWRVTARRGTTDPAWARSSTSGARRPWPRRW